MQEKEIKFSHKRLPTVAQLVDESKAHDEKVLKSLI